MGGKNARDRSTKLDPVVICISVDDGDDREERERERFNTRGEIRSSSLGCSHLGCILFSNPKFNAHNTHKHKNAQTQREEERSA